MPTDSQCSAPTPTGRDHLVAARLALLDAELALMVGNANNAEIQLDLAQAYIAEARKILPSK